MSENQGSAFPSLLQTKLYAPALNPGLIHRAQVVDRLNEHLLGEGRFGRKLTIFAAPAGYGKTTLTCQWLQALKVPVAWLSLEEADSDLNRFLQYLIASLQFVFPDLGRESLAMLQAPHKPPHEVILTILINDLIGKRTAMAVLVLDDYHVIQSAAIHQALNFLVEHIPDTLHLAIATREDPPLPLPRLQAKGQALIIRQSDLAFNEMEAVEFFNQRTNLKIAEAEARALIRRTEGWVTGLQLAAISMQGIKDQAEFIRSFTGSNRYVLDYLLDEVFSQQSQDIQDFLLKTSVLDRFCSELCDEVLQKKGSKTIIKELERAHFFIIPLDQTRQWYRYHRLFGDLLLHRLRTNDHDLQDPLYLRASEWCEAHGYPSEAIRYALAAKDWERSAHLIIQEEQSFFRKGEITLILSWCEAIPDSIRLERPDLGLAHAWALILIGEIDRAGAILEAVEAKSGESKQLQGEIASAKAFISRTLGDMPQTITFSKKALALLPKEDRLTRGTLSVNLGIITWHLGQLDETERVLQEGLADSLATHNHYSAHTAQVFLGRTLASRGRLREAKEVYLQALEAGDQVPTAVIAHHDMAALWFEWNDLAKSIEHLERASKIANNIHNSEFQIACSIQRALIHLELGELDAAGKVLQDSDQVLLDEDLPVLTRARRIACRFQLALSRGDLEAARFWLESTPVEHDAHPFNRFLDLNTARLHLAEGKLDCARSQLVKTYEQAERSGWGYAALIILVLQALASESREAALDKLEDALVQAESEGYIRLFLNGSESLIPLLKAAVHQGITPVYVEKLLSVVDKESQTSSARPVELIIEPLTDRELEVLRLVAEGMSNREIADKLIISTGTAKSHVHHLCGKLGVRNRTEAAMKAKELGLL